jgi:hypothetical protein
MVWRDKIYEANFDSRSHAAMALVIAVHAICKAFPNLRLQNLSEFCTRWASELLRICTQMCDKRYLHHASPRLTSFKRSDPFLSAYKTFSHVL